MLLIFKLWNGKKLTINPLTFNKMIWIKTLAMIKIISCNKPLRLPKLFVKDLRQQVFCKKNL